MNNKKPLFSSNQNHYSFNEQNGLRTKIDSVLRWGFLILGLYVVGVLIYTSVFPTAKVLVVTGCTHSECRWKEYEKSEFVEEFGDAEWSLVDVKGKTAVSNQTGRPLRMISVAYGGYVTGGVEKTIPPGFHIIDKRPNYLMEESPSYIKTRGGGSKNIIRWELWCN